MENNIDAKLEQAPVKKKATWITLRFILALIMFLITLFVFVAIADEIVLEHENKFDQSISTFIQSFQTNSLTQIMKGVTFFGSSTFLFPAYITLILYFLLRKKGRLALDITMIGLSSTGVLFLFKDIFKRHRPLDPLINNVTGFSFPSGHSFSSFTFFGLLIYILWQAKIHTWWKVLIAILLFLFACTIAFSRVYLRVHYPSDVVAGFCLSILWLMLSMWFLHKADRELSFSKKEKAKAL
ncbi:MAG: phosphatase PAP2 family protein [Bacteroidota bacterium]|nr:phosphatase PAP2 family protein [Bacteroidota bacterium]